jgi:biopolymer transport protein ExbB/TolQ
MFSYALSRIEMSVIGISPNVATNNLLLWRTKSLLNILERGGHPAGAGAAARELAELDRERFSSSFDLVGLLVWAIPILGFIGTVLGISLSVGSFSGVLTSLQGAGSITDQMQPALAGVTFGLAVAFDTTLLALLLSIPLLFANSMVRARVARHLDLVDESVLSEVLPALARAMEGKLGTDATSEGKLLADQLRALQAVARDMSEAMINAGSATSLQQPPHPGGNGSGARRLPPPVPTTGAQ